MRVSGGKWRGTGDWVAMEMPYAHISQTPDGAATESLSPTNQKHMYKIIATHVAGGVRGDYIQIIIISQNNDIKANYHITYGWNVDKATQ